MTEITEIKKDYTNVDACIDEIKDVLVKHGFGYFEIIPRMWSQSMGFFSSSKRDRKKQILKVWKETEIIAKDTKGE